VIQTLARFLTSTKGSARGDGTNLEDTVQLEQAVMDPITLVVAILETYA